MGETMAALLYFSLVGSGRPSERATESRTHVGRQHVSSLYIGAAGATGAYGGAGATGTIGAAGASGAYSGAGSA